MRHSFSQIAIYVCVVERSRARTHTTHVYVVFGAGAWQRIVHSAHYCTGTHCTILITFQQHSIQLEEEATVRRCRRWRWCYLSRRQRRIFSCFSSAFFLWNEIDGFRRTYVVELHLNLNFSVYTRAPVHACMFCVWCNVCCTSQSFVIAIVDGTNPEQTH